ncbi:MAG: glucuronate isomerase [Bacteroidaceae bacterium]|nr:glucuronate isomerase [Bacteroidaceae bacterium]
MKTFMDRDFLLQTDTARELYHRHAASQPIIDYHCHLDPAMVDEDHRFRSITELWLGGDHYKWRAMRTNGVPERLITGDASDWEKFEAWAATVPYTLRNPLYHWTHLELKTVFGINDCLSPQTARSIYDRCNDRLQNDPAFTARGLMRHYHVEVVCTTDDPVDDLHHHRAYKEQMKSSGNDSPRMLPAWRPDKAMAVESPEAFRKYVNRLAEAADIDIRTFGDFTDALQRRHDFFHAEGCRLSDHGLEEFYATPYTDTEIDVIFNKVYDGDELSATEIRKFKSAMLYFFAVQDAEAGWVQQYHYGALRNNNSRMMQQLGPDTGFDSIGQWQTARELSRFLDLLDSEERLAKTILYNLNPADNEMIATMLGNFQDGSVAGKIQWGSGWWFLDQKDGMERQMNALSLLGLLSRFVGMLTDSRSFLSYPRHEYFRRTLCNLLGNDIEQGLMPFTGYEEQRVRQMVEDICYNNAKCYFGM